MRMRIDESTRVSWPDPWLGAQHDVHMCGQTGKWTGSWRERYLELLDMEVQCTLIPKLIGEVPTGTTIIMRWYRDAIVSWIKVKAWVKIRMFEETLCDIVMSPLPKCIIWMDIMSDWRIFLLLNIIKQKAYKFVLQVLLIGHAKWEFIVYPIQVINLNQY